MWHGCNVDAAQVLFFFFHLNSLGGQRRARSRSLFFKKRIRVQGPLIWDNMFWVFWVQGLGVCMGFGFGDSGFAFRGLKVGLAGWSFGCLGVLG